MITYIIGDLVSIDPTELILECGGIGYALNISLNTYEALNGKKKAKVYVHEVIREDTYALYGFAEERERALFSDLITVSGVGPNTARLVLSSSTPEELRLAIASGDTKTLTSVKGIGTKTAQRIIVDLQNKMKLEPGEELSVSKEKITESEEAIAALIMLGFSKPAVTKVVQKITKNNPEFSIEQIIKTALRML